MDGLQDRIVLFWRHLGPYHVARARAAAERLGGDGVETVVLELCGSEETRDWDSPSGGDELRVVTVRPEDRLEETTPDMSGEVLALLKELRPRWIAVAGYDRPEMRGALKWGRRNGAVTVLMSETKWDDRPRPWWKRWLASRVVRRVDAGLVSGSAAGEYLVSLGMPRERIFRQYGCVDNQFFAGRAGNFVQRTTPRFFIASCRLIEARKNLKGLLVSYQAYREIMSDESWDLVICGDGQDRQEIMRFVEGRNLDCVRFAGFQQYENLARFYAEASCLVHTAINEAWGLVVNEAMAAGLPVLVSRRCGCAWDLVHEGVNGWTFSPYDPGELARRMVQVCRLSDEERKRMGQASSAIINRFGCDQFANGLIAAMGLTDSRTTRVLNTRQDESQVADPMIMETTHR